MHRRLPVYELMMRWDDCLKLHRDLIRNLFVVSFVLVDSGAVTAHNSFGWLHKAANTFSIT